MPECIVWPISMEPTVALRVFEVTLMTEGIMNVIPILGLRYAMNITMVKSAR